MGLFKKLESLIEKELNLSSSNNQPHNEPERDFNNSPSQPQYQQQYQQPPALMSNHPTFGGHITPTSSNYGSIKRCPSCGTVLDSFAVKCPDCGYEIRNVSAVSSFVALSQRLDAVDGEIANINANKKRGFFDSLLGDDMYDEVFVSKKKAEIIKTFPIPNTREDLVEFLMNSIPLSKKPFKKSFLRGKSDEEFDDEMSGGPILRRAWKQKSEQVIFKAKTLFKNEPKLLAEISRFENELRH